MSQTSQSCREHAEECRELARMMRGEANRQMMREIIEAWEELAKAKEAQEARCFGVAGS